LTQYQLIPYKRSTELIEDLFNHHLSQESLVTFDKDCYEKLEVIENNIRNAITSSSGAVYFDETGVYIDKKRNWLHVAPDETFTNTNQKRSRCKLECRNCVIAV